MLRCSEHQLSAKADGTRAKRYASSVDQISLTVPTLTTRRLRLEPISPKHSQGMFDLWSDADVCRYSGIVRDYDGNVIDLPASSCEDSNRILDFWLSAAADGWGFRWAVLLLGSAEWFTGIVGFNSVKDCSEIAYHLIPTFWGQGVMTEAAGAAIDWQRGNGVTEVEAFIDPENTAAIALAARLGMTGTDQYRDGARRYQKNL